MTLRELTMAFFQHHAVWVYVILGLLCVGLAASRPAPIARIFMATSAAALIYPVTWYALHRWVLHGKWMFKTKLTAGIWKRVHYDHHIDPNHLEVLLGALYTTLPTIALTTGPIGWLLAGPPGAAAAFATGLFVTCAYEYVHCIEHLPYKPRNRMLTYMKARHLEHHFHDESGNYGITNFAWDRLFGTFYTRDMRQRRSPTVFNLGYTKEVAQRYPWVAERSGGEAPDRPTRRRSNV